MISPIANGQHERPGGKRPGLSRQVILIFELIMHETPLAMAAEQGHLKVVSLLLEARHGYDEADPLRSSATWFAEKYTILKNRWFSNLENPMSRLWISQLATFD